MYREIAIFCCQNGIYTDDCGINVGVNNDDRNLKKFGVKSSWNFVRGSTMKTVV